MSEKPFGLAVKALLHDDRGRYLLIRRSLDSKHWPGAWDLPGGKVDPGEDFDVAMCREVLEETGLHIQLEGIVGAVELDLEHVTVAALVMEASVPSGDIQLSSEHGSYEWIPRKDLAECDFCNALNGLVSAYAQGESSG
jgi:8-oxo-dGTP diphosphatase